MTVYSTREAWDIVREIFPGDYAHDKESSEKAGYPIYRSIDPNRYLDRICDLNNRLEVVRDSSNLSTINIWIERKPTKVTLEPDASAEDLSAADRENLEQRKLTARRVQRLCYFYTKEYMHDMEIAAYEEAERAKMKEEAVANPDVELKCMVMVGECNAKAMYRLMAKCVKIIELLQNMDEDVNSWMLAGINAMFEQCSKDGYLPFDLPDAIGGILHIEYR